MAIEDKAAGPSGEKEQRVTRSCAKKINDNEKRVAGENVTINDLTVDNDKSYHRPVGGNTIDNHPSKSDATDGGPAEQVTANDEDEYKEIITFIINQHHSKWFTLGQTTMYDLKDVPTRTKFARKLNGVAIARAKRQAALAKAVKAKAPVDPEHQPFWTFFRTKKIAEVLVAHVSSYKCV